METKDIKKVTNKILYIAFVLILVVVAVKLYDRFEEKNFNEFIRSEYHLYNSFLSLRSRHNTV